MMAQRTLAIRIAAVPRGRSDRINSVPNENFNPGLTLSISIENFNLDGKFQSRGVSIYRALLVLQRRARSKISIHDRSLEIFNPEGRDRFFSIPGPCSDSAVWDFAPCGPLSHQPLF